MHGNPQNGVPVSLSGYGGLVTLADQASLPEGASPRTYDTDFIVGLTKSRAGLRNAYPTVNAEVGPNAPTAASSSSWSSPAAIFATGSNYASFGPVSNANSITITDFTFDIPTVNSITGLLLTLNGYATAPAQLTAQLLINGSPVGEVKTVSLPQSAGAITLGALTDGWNASVTANDLNSVTFGVQISVQSSAFPLATAYLNAAKLTVGVSTGTSNFNWIQTFTWRDGTVRNLALDASGALWMENVTTAPGTLTEILTGITPSSLAVGIEGEDVAYIAFTKGLGGSDMPLQYMAQWVDRITQVGPGAAPVFTPVQASTTQYPIIDITQYPASTQQFIEQLWSTGPGSTAPGNVITIYYSQTPDSTLVNAVTQGFFPVYVYMSNLVFTPANGVFQVTGVGSGTPVNESGQTWYYFTYVIGQTGFGFNRQGTPGNYQMSIATLTTQDPVPSAQAGAQITVAGNSVTNWNSAWTVLQAPNASAMAITGSQVSSGVATLNYAVVNGTAPPAVGQLVTITGTTNANGQLNVTNATIASATGGNTGSFTLQVSFGDFSFTAEDGQATTAGTIFLIDPGAALVGTDTSPIYGTGTGGYVTYGGPSGQFLATGTKQGTVFFITRNGYYTAPAPPVTFVIPENTTAILASQIPIGPPNVIARGIAFTESGQNGTPGANFFTIPTPVKYVVTNTTYTASQLIINDNTTSSAQFFFTDPVLLSAEAIDVYGYNLFNQIEIGDPGWIAAYSTRNFYGNCMNKVQNFNNLSFDGGYNLGATPTPLGWTAPDAFGSLVVSPKFGNAYYIKNISGSPESVLGLISQSAYQDAYQQSIINANTAYSVRVQCSNPSAITGGGALWVTLTANGITYGSFNVLLSSMQTNMGFFSGTFLTNVLPTVPQNLTLNVYGTNFVVDADLLIDRIDIYPTAIPFLTTTVFGSYAGLPEQVDAITGAVGFSSENQQPVNGAMVLYDTLYGLKGWTGNAPGSSLYSLQASANLEPAQWQEPEVAQRSGGACGPYAFDLGEQWFLGASRMGLYLFVGGQPGKIMQEIYQVWDAINWEAADTIWVKVDVVHRRILMGVPLATPNFWLPNAPVNANPTSPNVILMCNYQGLDSGEALKSSPQMHTTMFGTLNAIDMRRKWSIWQIPSPYGAIIQGATDQEIAICNGIGSSKVYVLDDTQTRDDGAIIDSLYTTAGLPELSKRAQMQGLGGFGNTRTGYMWAALESGGTVNVRLLPNRLTYPEPSGYTPWTVPGGFAPGSPALYDSKCPANFWATRTFVEFRENDGFGFSLSNLTLQMRKDTWNPTTGGKQL